MPKPPEPRVIAGFDVAPLASLLAERRKLAASIAETEAAIPQLEKEVSDFMRSIEPMSISDPKAAEALRPIEGKKAMLEMAPNYLARYKERMTQVETEITAMEKAGKAVAAKLLREAWEKGEKAARAALRKLFSRNDEIVDQVVDMADPVDVVRDAEHELTFRTDRVTQKPIGRAQAVLDFLEHVREHGSVIGCAYSDAE